MNQTTFYDFLNESKKSEFKRVPSKKEEKAFIDFFLYVFKAPTIVMPGYEDTITKEMQEKVLTYRMMSVKDIDEQMCTDYEVALYLMTASLMAVMPHDWSKIYMHVFSKYFDYKLIDPDNKPPELYENEMYDLKRLKQWIFKKQKEHLKHVEKNQSATVQ